jgi:hypothetical protein
VALRLDPVEADRRAALATARVIERSAEHQNDFPF